MSFSIGDKVKIKESTTDVDLKLMGINLSIDFIRKQVLVIDNVFGGRVSVTDQENRDWIIDTKFLEKVK